MNAMKVECPLVSEAPPQLIERTIAGLHEDIVRKLPDLDRSVRILDIGCGTGAWLQRLSSIGYYNLCGIDQDVSQFQAVGPTCFQADMDYDDLGLEGRKFDLITAIEVIEHLENPGRLFYHVARRLDAQGWFLLTTPNIHSVNCRLRYLITGKLKSFDEKGDPTHIYPVLLTALNRVLPRYGLRVERQWGYPENGSLVSRPITRLASALFERFLPQEAYGDTLCLLINRVSEPNANIQALET